MDRRMSCFVAWALVTAVSTTTLADDYDDFREALAARAKPITSFELVVRQVHLDLKPEDYNDFRQSVQRASEGQADSPSPSAWAQRLVQAWTESPNWVERHMTHRGDHFKDVHTQRGGKFVDIDVYDGLLYYSYCKINKQLDVYLKVPNIAHINLGSLGVGGRGPSPERLLSFERTSSGTRVVFTAGRADSHLLTYDYGPGLERRHQRDAYTPTPGVPAVETETWYLFHETVDGCPVPRVTVYLSINRPRERSSGIVRIVDRVRVNCPLSDDSLSLGEVPPNTLVVDYRFGLSTQWRYSDYLQARMNGNAKAEDFIEFLSRTKGERDAASTRDGRVGRMAPALQVSEWLQKPTALEKWPTGRPMILEFWNISCGPCIGSIPENNELAAWIRGKGGSFISIHSATHEPAAIREFLSTHGVGYAVGLDTPGGERPYWGSATFAAYGINGIPTCVTIGRSGRVLSYEHLSTQELEQLLENEPQEPPRGRRNAEVRPLTLLPKAWLAWDLEPGSAVEGRLFLFRPDTADLTLRTWKGADGPVQATWQRHSANGQTVYEVSLKAEAPKPGEVLKGQITLIAEHNQQEMLLDVPYELAARQ